MVSQERRAEFAELFEEFTQSYVGTEEGQGHAALYAEGREQGRCNYEAIVAADQGEDVTDRVLLKLLPHMGTPANRQKGAWIHVAPTVRKDVKEWFEGAKWVKPGDWPRVSQAILQFIRRCTDDPNELRDACAELDALPDVKGLQAGMLSPILNALRPDDFLIYNNKTRSVINHFAGTPHQARLTDYPAANETGRTLIEALAQEMEQPAVAGLLPEDRFDMFSHWLFAVAKYFAKKPQQEPRHWKIAPGEGAWNWESCRENGFIAIGWSELGDLSGLKREEFNQRRDEQVAQHDDWTKTGADQAWTFSRIEKGDRIVANEGTGKVLGIGTVTGPYEFVEGERHAHRVPVRWDALEERRVDEPGWRRTLVKLDAKKFDAICNAPIIDEPDVNPDCPFSLQTFQLLAGLHEIPTMEFYSAHRDEFKAHVEDRFRGLLQSVCETLPAPITALMETEHRVFGRIPKNDFGQGGAWDFYWGAFYPKGGQRIQDAQLFLWMNHERLEYGFYIGEYGTEQRKRFVRHCNEHGEALASILEPVLSSERLVFGRREGRRDHSGDNEEEAATLSWRAWLADPEEAGIHVATLVPKATVIQRSKDELVELIGDGFQRVFPLVLLAVSDDPVLEIEAYLEPEPRPINLAYPLEELSERTGFELSMLERWVRAVERKKQAVIYGPPGTGKTYVAEGLAKHLIGGGNGFADVVQFHPAYAYEDFVQGIRPRGRADGGLDYPVVPGRFLDFCRRATKIEGTCVLIIDEINRADLARVFGELMYLLEYRKEEVPLAAGGRFRIPDNVRIIGTMNTADRSIALVDHALRRRFAFLALYPNYDALRRFHQEKGFPAEGLIQVLQRLNQQIGDRHYEVGISFFLRDDLAQELEDIWKMEIEPYLDEYFFDQRGKVDAFRWDSIKAEVLP